jgi:hypothetical protein
MRLATRTLRGGARTRRRELRVTDAPLPTEAKGTLPGSVLAGKGFFGGFFRVTRPGKPESEAPGSPGAIENA